jgi:putative SOS response-associated peptidase YedK
LRRGGGNPSPARYNVAPSTNVPILRLAPDGGALELTQARWGLIPSWWTKAKLPTHTINARSEDAASKPMWRHPYRHTRCLIPALGWYEWTQAEVIDKETGAISRVQRPHFLFLPKHRPLCFAGLMSTWSASGEGPILTCTILTRPASASSAEIHDRMPLVLRESAHAAWCDTTITDAERIDEIARTQAIEEIEHYVVSRTVDSARAEGPQLIEAAGS